MFIRTIRLVALLSFTILFNVSNARAQSVTIEHDGIDSLGLDTSCNIWDTPNDSTQPNLAYCEEDLTLIKNLGVGWVRIGVPWYFLAKYGPTFLPARAAFLENFLKAARARGLKVLFQIGLEAPAWAYHDPADPTVTGPSSHLDFNDTDFGTFLDQELAIAKKYTDQYEIFNEVNWQYKTNEGEPTADALLSRMKGIYMMTKQHLDALTAQDPTYHPTLLSSGISYFCSSPDCDTTNLVPATDFIYWMAHGWQPTGSNILADFLTTVSVHPYFSPSLYGDKVSSFSSYVDANVAPSNGHPKEIWMTETNVGNPITDNQATLFSDVISALRSGYSRKAFWYIIRPSSATDTSCSSSVGSNYCWSIYQYDGYLKPGNSTLENAILAATEAIPFDLRFAPPTQATVSYDLADNLQSALAYGNGYPPTGTQLSVGNEVALRDQDSLSKHVSFRIYNYHSVQADFDGISIPSSGYPAFRMSFSATSLPQRGTSVCAGGNLLVWIGIPGGRYVQRSFNVPSSGMPQTAEIDLHDFLGQRINISLDAIRYTSCDTTGHGPIEFSVFRPQVLTR